MYLFSIKFEFSLAAYVRGSFAELIFSTGIDLVIFGKELYLSLAFNLRDPVGSVRVGGDKSVNWYKDKMNQANPTDTSENYYDNPTQFVDFELSGKM